MDKLPDSHVQHLSIWFIWFVKCCRWLWKKQGLFWTTVVLGILMNVFVASLFLPFDNYSSYRKLPIGAVIYWATQHTIGVLCIGLLLLLLGFIIFLGSRYPGEEMNKYSRFPKLNVVTPIGMPSTSYLVGRRDELERILTAMRTGSLGGLCVLTGMSGVGKSVLAATTVKKILIENPSIFPGGAAWISCENLSGNAGLSVLWLRIARLLGIDLQEASFEQMQDALALAITRRPRTLLVLDNLESVLDTSTVVKLLVVPGHTALLLTSIETIDAEMDDRILLGPLSQPDSIQLFTERLYKNDSRRPTEAESDILTQIVKELGGLPLAIELAAAYAIQQKVGLDRLLEEVRIDGLHGINLDARYHGLRTRFDRLWRVLPEHQQHLFAGMSLLSGDTFPRAAADAVAQVTGGSGRRDATPRKDVSALVKAALVEAIEGERLRLHPLLRQYAVEQSNDLQTEVKESIGNAILSFWLDYARRHFDDSSSLTREAQNLMAGLVWAHEHKRQDELLTLVHLLDRSWDISGRRTEEAHMYAWVIEAAISMNNLYEQRWATWKLALVDARQGRMQEARKGFNQVLEVVRQSNDPIERIRTEREVVHVIAVMDQLQGQVQEAQRGFKQVLELARQTKDPVERIEAERAAVHGLARVASLQASRKLKKHENADQKIKDARKGFERALKLSRQLKDPVERLEGERAAEHELARLDHLQARVKDACQGFEHTLTISRKLGDYFSEATDLRHLGFAIGCDGQLSEGMALINKALEYFEQIGDVYASGLCYMRLADLERDNEHSEQAISYYKEALRRFLPLQSPNANEVREELRKLGEEA